MMRYEWRLSLKRNVPSPPRRTRGGEASTKPSWFVEVDLVEAARTWGGQPCVLSRTKLSQYRVMRWVLGSLLDWQ